MLADDDWGSPVAERVVAIVRPILSDLGLELYDCEYSGSVLRITAHEPGGAKLDTLSLATRLISREFDHIDPIPAHYTLEVTSPGLERTLRRPRQFVSAIGDVVSVRLTGSAGDDRRLHGTLVAADAEVITVRDDDDADLAERTVRYDQIDRAKTIFAWGPPPKAGKGPKPAGRQSSAPGPSTPSEIGVS